MLILNHYFEKAALGFPAGGWVPGSEARCVCVCVHARAYTQARAFAHIYTREHLCLEDNKAQEGGDLVRTFLFAQWQVLPRSAEMT